MKTKKIALVSMIVIIGALLGACAQQEVAPPEEIVVTKEVEVEVTREVEVEVAPVGGTITIGMPAEATGYDIQTNGNDPTIEKLNFIYDRLVDLDENLEPQPVLAESWEQVDDTTWIFHLREGVKFSNGREMTADDVVISYDRSFDPEVGSYLLNKAPFKKATKIDDYTVQIELFSKTSSFWNAMAIEAASIIPGKEFLEGTFDPTVDVMGTGPFMLEEHLKEESWTLVRNPHYWKAGLPNADSIVIRIIEDESALLAALRDGSIDMMRTDNFDALVTLDEIEGVVTVGQDQAQTYNLYMNSVNPDSVLLDGKLRQAINLAINKEELAELSLAGYGIPAMPAVQTSDPCDVAAVPLAQYNPELAAEMVQELGAEGMEIELKVASAGAGAAPLMAQVIQAHLAEVGLVVNIVSVDFATFVEETFVNNPSTLEGMTISFDSTAGNPSISYGTWAADWQAPYSSLALNEEYLALNEQQATMDAGPERTVVFQQMCEMIYENASNIPLATKGHLISYRADQINARIHTLESAIDFFKYADEYSVINPE